MTEDMNLESVEAALAQPQNQPPVQTEASSLAPAANPQTPGRSASDLAANAAPQVGASALMPSRPNAAQPDAMRIASTQGSAAYAGLTAALESARRAASKLPSAAPMSTDGSAASPQSLANESLRKAIAPPVADNAPTAAQPPVPPVVPFSMGDSAFGRGQTRGYDYRGSRIEIPAGVGDADVRGYMDFANQMVDWMNED